MAATLYCAVGGPAETSDLYTLDPVTVVPTSVGPIGFALTGLAFDPTDNSDENLYGSTSKNSLANPKSLVRINRLTGAGTLIGPFGISYNTLADICFGPDGTLYGRDSNDGKTYVVDKLTGTATPLPDSLGTNYGGGLDFVDGVLWRIPNQLGDPLQNIDIVTGDETDLDQILDGDLIDNVTAGSYNFTTATFYIGDRNSSLYTVDLVTGFVTILGTASFDDGVLDAIAWLIPGASISQDDTHQQITLTFPTNSEVDRWEIARRPGIASQQVGDPDPSDVVATIPASSIDWIDRYPYRRFSSYSIRGRTSALEDTWTAWSSPVDNETEEGPILRAKLESPNSVLELAVQEKYGGFGLVGGSVETSFPYRFVVQAKDILELDFIWRAIIEDPEATDEFTFGFRWYDRNGLFIGESSDSVILELINDEPPSRTTVFRAVAPNNAAKGAIFFSLPELIVPHEVSVTTYLDLSQTYADYAEITATYADYKSIVDAHL